MAKNRTFLTPALDCGFVDLADDGLTFRKKILPLTTINYPTAGGNRRKIAFDRAYHDELIQSFKDGAYDHPTLQLATADNAHNLLPERTAGEITELSAEQPTDVDGPGLYATVRALSPEHAKLLRENTCLGASAQIKEGLEKVDGRKFGRAVRHILATLDPRVTSMGAFRAVSLSDDELGKVIDLSNAEYEEIKMAKAGKGKPVKADPTVDLSDEDIEAVLAEAAEALDAEDETDLADDEPFVSRPNGRRTDDPAFVSLSERVDDLAETARQAHVDLAESRWDGDKAAWSHAGVPKAFLDLAEPLLSKAGRGTVDLADSDGDAEVDAKGIVRGMLDLAKGLIDLSAPLGFGDDPEVQSTSDQEAALAADWAARSGPAK